MKMTPRSPKARLPPARRGQREWNHHGERRRTGKHIALLYHGLPDQEPIEAVVQDRKRRKMQRGVRERPQAQRAARWGCPRLPSDDRQGCHDQRGDQARQRGIPRPEGHRLDRVRREVPAPRVKPKMGQGPRRDNVGCEPRDIGDRQAARRSLPRGDTNHCTPQKFRRRSIPSYKEATWSAYPFKKSVGRRFSSPKRRSVACDHRGCGTSGLTFA